METTLPMLHEIFARTAKKLQKSLNTYSFPAKTREEINFLKIRDDLSYGKPLALVYEGDNMYAVVHHSIIDKYERSVLNREDNTCHSAIRGLYKTINPNEVSTIINNIRVIKNACWSKKDKTENTISVEVKLIKV